MTTFQLCLAIFVWFLIGFAMFKDNFKVLRRNGYEVNIMHVVWTCVWITIWPVSLIIGFIVAFKSHQGQTMMNNERLRMQGKVDSYLATSPKANAIRNVIRRLRGKSY